MRRRQELTEIGEQRTDEIRGRQRTSSYQKVSEIRAGERRTDKIRNRKRINSYQKLSARRGE